MLLGYSLPYNYKCMFFSLQMTISFTVVVEFIDEKSVEIVCEKWIETCDMG